MGADRISGRPADRGRTKFFTENLKWVVYPSADDEKLRKFYDLAVNELTGCGYDHYEISNFSKIGKESDIILNTGKYEEYLVLE